MFGYVLINKPEMKFREFEVYHSYYCGLCKTLGHRYGNTSKITLSYDMTFLTILLTGLYEPENRHELSRCLPHPIEKHKTITNKYTEYAADMNIILSYEKCVDDWKDEKKLFKKIYSIILSGKNKKVKKLYKKKAEFIYDKLKEIHETEKSGSSNIDEAAGLFGEILGEIYVMEEDIWSCDLRRMGFFLGKFIYLMDAYEDIDKDIKDGNYNPFKQIYKNQDFEAMCYRILTMMIAECCKAFEKLPIIENADIIRNILYSGVWTRYSLISKKRSEEHV